MLSPRYIPDLGNASVGIPIRKQNFSWPPIIGRFFFGVKLRTLDEMETVTGSHINIAGLEKTINQDGNSVRILDGIDLIINRSEVISVLGPSG